MMRAMPLLMALALSAASLAGAAWAQDEPPPLDLPSERRPEVPPFEPAEPAEPEDGLRPAPEALPETALPELTVFVRAVRIQGNTLLDAALLEQASRPFAGRELTTAQIEQLRERLTLLYVERGYVTSGALVPDQEFEDGVLHVRIVQGRVGELRIRGQRWFRESYLRQRILPDAEEPLEVRTLERRLQMLQADPQIQAVHAELRPGVRLGESELLVRVEERQPHVLSLETSNDRSPAIGAWNGEAYGGLRNPTGWGDLVELRGEFGESLRDVEARYAIPLTRFDTRLGLRFRWSESEVVESPFDTLDITSDFLTGGFDLSHPLYRTLGDDLRLGLIGEWRRGRNYVLGEGFSFSPGADEGVSVVSAARPYLEWLHRGRNQVLALRGQLSLGLPMLGHTDVAGAREDGTFTAGLLQAQWVRRFDEWSGIELVLRGDLQLAAEPLLPIEQFAIGGHANVRGYRESQVVRDNGLDASIELRIPILRRPDGTPVLQLAPFGDYGRAWDHADRDDTDAESLGSVGVGLRHFPTPWLRSELYWGYQLSDVANPHEDLQDYGFHLRLTATTW